MKIVSILRRPGGTFIKLGTVAYHFAPDEQDRHVADVTDPDHIERLLDIPEGYCALEETPAAVAPAIAAPAQATAPQASQEPQGDAQAAQATQERDALVAAYLAKFGKRPNGRLSIEKLRDAINA